MFKKKITFDCIYASESGYEKTPVVMADKMPKPDAKKIKQATWPDTNLAKCPAFFMADRFGFILRSPYTFKVKRHADGNIEVLTPNLDREIPMTAHGPEQHTPFFGKGTVLKITSNFMIKEKTGVDCMYLPAWQFNASVMRDFMIPSGFIDFKYNNAANFFLVIPEGGEKTFTINMGDPLAQVVPITEKKIELTHRIDHFARPVGDNNCTFAGAEYAARRRLMEQNQQMCPHLNNVR